MRRVVRILVSVALGFSVFAVPIAGHGSPVANALPTEKATAAASLPMTLTFPVNAIRVNPATGNVFATVDSSAGALLGNKLVEIDPTTGTVLRGVVVGSNPGEFSISDDGSVAWVGLKGSSQIVKVDLELFLKIGAYTTMQNGLSGLNVLDVEIQPGTTTVVAVSLIMSCCGATENVAIYDNGVIRPNRVNAVYENYDIAFSDVDPTKLYGIDTYTSANAFSRMSVDSTGVSTIDSTWDTSPGGPIKVVGGLVYGSYAVLDPTTLANVGSFGAPGAIEVAPDYSRAYQFNMNSELIEYDTSTFLEVSRRTVSAYQSDFALESRIERTAKGLALLTGDWNDKRITLLGTESVKVSVPVPWNQADTKRVAQLATYLNATPEQVQQMGVGFLAYIIGITGDTSVVPWAPPVMGLHAAFTSEWTFDDAPTMTAVQHKYASSDVDAHRLGVYILSYLIGLGGH